MEAARLDSHTQETLSAPAVEAALGLAERPEALLDKREELGEECQRAVKELFDLAKRLEPKRFTPLPELLVPCRRRCRSCRRLRTSGPLGSRRASRCSAAWAGRPR